MCAWLRHSAGGRMRPLSPAPPCHREAVLPHGHCLGALRRTQHLSAHHLCIRLLSTERFFCIFCPRLACGCAWGLGVLTRIPKPRQAPGCAWQRVHDSTAYQSLILKLTVELAAQNGAIAGDASNNILLSLAMSCSHWIAAPVGAAETSEQRRHSAVQPVPVATRICRTDPLSTENTEASPSYSTLPALHRLRIDHERRTCTRRRSFALAHATSIARCLVLRALFA